MWGVWGAPTHPILYIALLSSITLLLSAFVALAFPEAGRWISVVSILGIGVYYIPASQSLVPSEVLIVSPVAYLLIGGYFALLAFVLFHPKRFSFSGPVFVLSLMLAIGLSTHKLIRLNMDGEYRRPVIGYFNWTLTDAPLEITNSWGQEWFSQDMLALLSAKGIQGSLDLRGVQGSKGDRPKMLVIASGPIHETKELHFPKDDFVIYIFDGTNWTSIPEEPAVYPSFATLETDGMLWQKTSIGGLRGSSAFLWK